MQKIRSTISLLVTITIFAGNATPALAQLGDVTPPAPSVDPTPPEPVVTHPAPSVDPTPTPPPPVVTPPAVEPLVQTVTPPTDTTGPVISGVASLTLATHDASIVWITDELSVSTFQYGTTQSYGSTVTLGASAALGGTAVLTNLTPGTTYYYCIHATDISSNVSSSCGHTFTTASQTVVLDTTPPDISVITVVPITTTGATINFTTSEIGNARVEYGTSAGYGQTTNLNTSLALTHTVVLSNLTPHTLYHYRIISRDEIGNETITSDETFTTESITVGNVISSPTPQVVISQTDTTAPIISGIGTASLSMNDATLVWNTDELASSALEYGTTQSYGSQSTLSISALLAHSATLSGLAAGTTYYYCIHATDLAGNTANSCPHSFTTDPAIITAPSDTTPPQISLITVASIATSSATIAWTTSELATSNIQYGVTTNYGMTASLGNTPALIHTISLASLSPNTQYHYRIISSDTSHNSGMSGDETFTTSALPQVHVEVQGQPQVEQVPQVSSVLISGIETASISTSTVTIAWNTDLPSDSQIEYGNSESFGSLTVLNPALTTSHSVTIVGLAPNTNYIYKVKSKVTGASIATVSTNEEFNTLNHSTPVVPPANILSVSSGSVTATGATITWSTDKQTTARVEYGLNTGYGVQSAELTNLSASHSVTLSDLQSNTTYHYRVKSTDSVGNDTYSEDYMFTTSAVPTSNLNSTASVPAAVTTLAIGAYDNASVELAWHVANPSTDTSSEYEIRYSLTPITASNFSQAESAQLTPITYGSLSPNGTERTYIVAGLNVHSTYYFALKSRYENSAFSDVSNIVSITTTTGASINNEINQNISAAESIPIGAIITPQSPSVSRGSSNSTGGGHGYGSGSATTGSFEPTMIKAEPADGQIVFQWNNPGEANFVRTIVVRKEGGYPASPSDGQTIYEARGETYTDTGLQNGKTYYYSVYSYTHNKTYSKGVNISLAPSASNRQVKFNESGTLSSSTPLFHFVQTFQKGNKDIEIEHLQEILSVDGDSYPEKYVTGYFGALTQAALMRFQAKHRLLQTGIVDVATQKELNTISLSETKLNIPTDLIVFETDLKMGNQGDSVVALQQYLIAEGSYQEAIISGYFGGLTHSAVKIFQSKYNVSPVSGIVGPKTRHKMQQLVGL